MVARASVRQLEYLVAVADALHFGRAAKQCAVTQPALSAQIAAVEDLLGVQIFERGRRQVLVTAVGERVVAQARRTLQSLDTLTEIARSSKQPLAGDVRLGVIPTVAPYLLPRALPAVRRAYPELRLLLREDQTARIVRQLVEGRLDVVLLALPVEDAACEVLPLYEEPFFLLGPEGHPLAKKRAARVAESDLDGEDVLLLEDGHCLRAQALSVCKRAGAREAGNIQATSLPTLVQMVANGLGVSLLPQTALEVEVRPGWHLVVRPFREPAPARTIGLAWRRGSARAGEFRLLGEILERAARPLLDKSKLSKYRK